MQTVELIERRLMEQMRRGELAPGTWLRQDLLAESLGVSKIPVREALQRLAATGVLRLEANRGAVVPELTAGDAEEIYALRRSVEPLLLRRAIPRMTVVDLAEAQLATEDAGRPLAESNWAFHRALYRAAGWPRGLAVAEILHTTVAAYVSLYTGRLGGAGASEHQHAALLDACRARRTAVARRLLVEHLDDAAAALRGHLAGDAD